MRTVEVAVRTIADRESVLATLRALSSDRWSVPFGAGRMEWIQQAAPGTGDRIDFSATGGAFHRFDGAWEVCDSAGGGREVRYRARIELGVPIFDRIIEPLVVTVLRQAVVGMLVDRLPAAEAVDSPRVEDPESVVVAYLARESE